MFKRKTCSNGYHKFTTLDSIPNYPYPLELVECTRCRKQFYRFGNWLHEIPPQSITLNEAEAFINLGEKKNGN